MEQNHLFQAYLDDGDAFSSWVEQYPSLAERVETCLLVWERVKDSTHIVDLMAARDALQQLHMIAREGHFYAIVAIFSAAYDGYCCALLPYFYEVH